MSAVPRSINEQLLARPLYLAPKRSARLRVEGPSIRIQQAGGKPSNIPLRLISRICMNTKVSFDSDFILACAERGIILLIEDETGEPLARLLGRATQQSLWLQRLLDFTARPDWKERYQDWCYAQQRRIAGVVVKRVAAPAYLARYPDHLQDWIDNTASQLAGEHVAQRAEQKLQQVTYVWMLLRLQMDGLDASSEALRAETPYLTLDLSRLLARRLQPVRLKMLQKRHEWQVRMQSPARPLEDKTLLEIYEKASPRMERLGQDLINKLHRWLVEMN